MASRKKTASSKSTSSPADRLIGWLVSYEMDEMGKAYEVRAGRTLISSHDMNGNRAITVTEGTVSSPHSALHASKRHEILVQDIFSDHGTYLKRSDSKKEQPISGPVELEHGDWIRIGDYTRLQLCLIEGSNR